MGRRAKSDEEKSEQFPVYCPPGGVERANALAEKLAGGNRSAMFWRLMEAAEAAVERGADLETIEASLRGGKPVSEEIQRQAKVGRAMLKAMEAGGYGENR